MYLEENLPSNKDDGVDPKLLEILDLESGFDMSNEESKDDDRVIEEDRRRSLPTLKKQRTNTFPRNTKPRNVRFETPS
jgi:hypothetical protein